MARIGPGRLGLALLLPLFAAAPVRAQGCAMCGGALGGADDPLGRAISWSVLFLMAAPYLIVAVAGAWIFYMHRRASARRRGAVIDLARSAARLRPAAAGDHPEGEMP